MADNESVHDLDSAILEEIEAVGPIPIPTLAERLAVHPMTVERRCLALQRNGLVKRSVGGAITATTDDESVQSAAIRRNGRPASD
ncbi:winged helix-turn-helix transcriptional regulator [Natrialbaceae archaeon A-arb3/5]